MSLLTQYGYSISLNLKVAHNSKYRWRYWISDRKFRKTDQKQLLLIQDIGKKKMIVKNIREKRMEFKYKILNI